MKRGKKYNICIVTYEIHTNPITRNLSRFLVDNYNTDILYIYHPYLDFKESYKEASKYEYYRDERLVEKKVAIHWRLPVAFLYLKDILYTFFWCIKFGKRWDLYFAAGNLNPFVGIVLKRIGLVKKVVYYSMDYYPKRFENKFFNLLYYQLDKFCVRFSDETWNASSVMVKAREEKMGMERKIYNRQITVPVGIWFYKIKRLPFSKINKKKIVYRGTLQDHMGVDLAIRAMSLILKEIPDVTLEIFGGGQEEENLKKLTRELRISKQVIFHGWIDDRAKLEKSMADGALGIATFNTNILDDKVKNADPGKIKDYMVMGMPVITTNALFYHKEIEKRKCGIVIQYDPTELASAVIKLITNEKMLLEYKKNAIRFIEQFDYEKIFKENLSRVLGEKQ